MNYSREQMKERYALILKSNKLRAILKEELKVSTLPSLELFGSLTQDFKNLVMKVAPYVYVINGNLFVLEDTISNINNVETSDPFYMLVSRDKESGEISNLVVSSTSYFQHANTKQLASLLEVDEIPQEIDSETQMMHEDISEENNVEIEESTFAG